MVMNLTFLKENLLEFLCFYALRENFSRELDYLVHIWREREEKSRILET